MVKKQAILIQCHNKPEQINKIIEAFGPKDFDIFIHVDKKSDILESINNGDNVFFIKNRVDVMWGQYSQVQATLALMECMEDSEKYSYVHLISGADFPIKSQKWFLEKFNESNSIEYIESNYLDGKSTWAWGGLDRIYCFYPQWIIQRPKHKLIKTARILYREFIMRTKVFMRRNPPADKFYGGSSWWSLTGEMVAWMKEYLENHIEYCDFFKHGVCVDEVFFSTLAMISPYADRVANNHMRYMLWGVEGNNSGGPAPLEKKDIYSMINSEYAFARKFDSIDVVLELSKKLNNMEK